MNYLFSTVRRIWQWVKGIFFPPLEKLPRPDPDPTTDPNEGDYRNYKTTLPSLDAEKIEIYRRRRLVLDWRDNCIFKIHDTASFAITQLSEEIDRLLIQLPIWKKIHSDPAFEVLEPYFSEHVKPLFIKCLCDVIDDANKMSFLNMKTKSEMEEMKNIISEMDLKNINTKFKHINREKIINSISDFIKGGEGALRVQKAALSLAEKMIK